MKLHVINTGNFKLDGGAMFGVVPKSIWNKLVPADENNLCNWAMRCLLIEEGDRRILVDTGIGNKQDEKFFRHYFLNGDDSLEASLKRAGFTPADITDVLLTHLHFDHVGGAVNRVDGRLVPAFPNAVYWSNERHWNWAIQPNDREKASFLKENILPIEESGLLQFIDIKEPLTRFSENISIRFAHGHTDAMMLPQISYKNQTIVYMADLLPSTAHVPIPYIMGYDMFPMQTITEKKSFLREAADNQYVLFFEHDLLNECATVAHTDKGIRIDQLFTLDSL